MSKQILALPLSLFLFVFSGSVISGQRPASGWPIVYRVLTSRAYHTASCPVVREGQATSVSLVAALADKLTPCPICRPDADEDVTAAMIPARRAAIDFVSPDDAEKYQSISYFTQAARALRAAPDMAAPVRGHIAAATVAAVADIKPGWIRIWKDDVVGWTTASPADIVPRSPVEAMIIQLRLQAKSWPVAIKTDVLMRRVRVGFSKDQVVTTLGSPLGTTTEETSRGTSEVLTFPAEIVTLTNGRVSRIVTSR